MHEATDRTKRVKDARSEAQKEIEDYRNQKEEEFKTYEQQVIHLHPTILPTAVSADIRGQHTSGNKAAEEEAEKDTQEKLKEIKQIGEKKGPKVVDDLIKAVLDVQLVVPERVSQATV